MIKYCYKCNRHKPAKSGTLMKLAVGIRFVCATCQSKIVKGVK